MEGSRDGILVYVTFWDGDTPLKRVLVCIA